MAKGSNKRNVERADVKNLTAGDILAMSEFDEILKRNYKQMLESRTNQVKWAKNIGRRLKRTLADWLIEEGIQADDISKLYKTMADGRKIIGFTSNQRKYIFAIGMEAYRQTLLALMKEEKENVVEKKKKEA